MASVWSRVNVRAGCSGLCPGEFWVSPKMAILWLLWERPAYIVWITTCFGEKGVSGFSWIYWGRMEASSSRCILPPPNSSVSLLGFDTYFLQAYFFFLSIFLFSRWEMYWLVFLHVFSFYKICFLKDGDNHFSISTVGMYMSFHRDSRNTLSVYKRATGKVSACSIYFLGGGGAVKTNTFVFFQCLMRNVNNYKKTKAIDLFCLE